MAEKKSVKAAAAKAEETVKTAKKTARTAAKKAEENLKDAATVAEIEAKKTTRKVTRKVKDAVEDAEAKVEKKAAKAKAAKVEIVVQSPMGGSITAEEIAAKVPAGCESVYVRVDKNKLYWVKGEESGSVDIWE